MSDLLDALKEELKNASVEDRQELAAILKDLEPKKKEEARQLGDPIDRRPRGNRGELLSPEEAWDKDHPLSILHYGYYVESQCYGGKRTEKRYTKQEINEYNAEQLRIWLTAKREVFPDCLEPEINPDTGKVNYLYR